MFTFDSIEGHHGPLGKRCPFEGKRENEERIICPCSAIHPLETELNAAISISARDDIDLIITMLYNAVI